MYLGSPVAPICTIKKIKSSPICLQLGLVLFLPSARFWGLEVCPQAKVTKAVQKTISGALTTWTTMTSWDKPSQHETNERSTTSAPQPTHEPVNTATTSSNKQNRPKPWTFVQTFTLAPHFSAFAEGFFHSFSVGSWGRFFWSFFKLSEMRMRQVIKHREIKLLKMIRRTDLGC